MNEKVAPSESLPASPPTNNRPGDPFGTCIRAVRLARLEQGHEVEDYVEVNGQLLVVLATKK